MIGGGHGSVPASGQWEIDFSSLSVAGSNTGITGTAVPDSGTTLIISPSAETLAQLYLKICDAWEDCRKDDGAKGDNIDDFYASVARDCGSTLPPLSFNFGSVSASIPGSSYVVSSNALCTPAFD